MLALPSPASDFLKYPVSVAVSETYRLHSDTAYADVQMGDKRIGEEEVSHESDSIPWCRVPDLARRFLW
jgi:hypothetical protein